MTHAVLLVEDDHDVRETIAEILLHEGYEVVTAADGEEALGYLRGGMTPSVIVLDLMMPGMDGFQFRAAQRADPMISAFPIIVLSADRHAEQKLPELDAAGYLRKPTRLADLLAVIKRVVDEIPAV